MPAKALEAEALARLMRLMMGSFRQVGTHQEGKGILCNISINKETLCVCEVYTETEETV